MKKDEMINRIKRATPEWDAMLNNPKPNGDTKMTVINNPKVMYRFCPEQSIGSAAYHKVIRIQDVGVDGLVLCAQTICDFADSMTFENEATVIHDSYLKEAYSPTTEEADAQFATEAKQMKHSLAECPL